MLQILHCFGNKVALDSASGMVDLGEAVAVNRKELYKHATWPQQGVVAGAFVLILLLVKKHP